MAHCDQQEISCFAKLFGCEEGVVFSWSEKVVVEKPAGQWTYGLVFSLSSWICFEMAVEEGQTDLEIANNLFLFHEVDVVPDSFKDVSQNLEFLGGVVDRRYDEEFVEAGEERGVCQLSFFIFLVVFELF